MVLEVLQNEDTLNAIASKNNITPKNLQNWKKVFLENAEIAMEPAGAVQEYKTRIVELEAKNDEYASLSEFSHPNFLGVCGTYGKIREGDTTVYTIKLVDAEKHWKEAVDALYYGLKMINYFIIKIYDSTDDLIETYNELNN